MMRVGWLALCERSEDALEDIDLYKTIEASCCTLIKQADRSLPDAQNDCLQGRIYVAYKEIDVTSDQSVDSFVAFCRMINTEGNTCSEQSPPREHNTVSCTFKRVYTL